MKSKKPTTSKTTRERPARRTKPADIPSVSVNLHERIARRAYEIYERRIGQGALNDWLQAEREILGQTQTPNADMPHRGGDVREEQD